ncbi:bifunctional 2-polyprenyl-6-hydroxyphenol methylase/3-demethylubiquinol 3-O-methyltransferase UbiG [Candidatus Spongiihabitans sp.]|uniref:bifunctional 2-polyprenyl-6-hydroxyphenol methylase/3-demethylubiquinol 3-O-methyltransferase UbiG n=1 Tax=Candidatus Spongiihabitans sp. TaxID=3101308 RepID=UPI003C7C1512
MSKKNTRNIDDAEIKKFSAAASRWWDTESEFKPLHQINPLRLDFIDQRTPLDGKMVLDVGCGGGILSEAMALRGAKVTGIDAGESALEVARLHALESKVKVDYQKITAEDLARQSPGKWDIVTCMELLEHVPDPSSVVTACAALAKPDGAVYFSTINRNPKSFLFAIVGAEYLLNLVPRGTHNYEKLIRPSELNQWGEAAGLNTEELTGMHYNPIFQSYRLGPGLEVNYIMRTIKISP